MFALDVADVHLGIHQSCLCIQSFSRSGEDPIDVFSSFMLLVVAFVSTGIVFLPLLCAESKVFGPMSDLENVMQVPFVIKKLVNFLQDFLLNFIQISGRLKRTEFGVAL